jgi:hypothetical protein
VALAVIFSAVAPEWAAALGAAVCDNTRRLHPRHVAELPYDERHVSSPSFSLSVPKPCWHARCAAHRYGDGLLFGGFFNE